MILIFHIVLFFCIISFGHRLKWLASLVYMHYLNLFRRCFPKWIALRCWGWWWKFKLAFSWILQSFKRYMVTYFYHNGNWSKVILLIVYLLQKFIEEILTVNVTKSVPLHSRYRDKLYFHDKIFSFLDIILYKCRNTFHMIHRLLLDL